MGGIMETEDPTPGAPSSESPRQVGALKGLQGPSAYGHKGLWLNLDSAGAHWARVPRGLGQVSE